jgi:DNA repair exonuclease SbcCD ATPase subunit
MGMGLMHSQILELSNKIQQLQTKKQTLIETRDKAEKRLEISKQKYNDGLKGRKIIQEVALKVQKNLELFISRTVTMALNAVIKESIEFRLKFETKRNQTECNPVFIEHGTEQHPLESAGGGAADIASFALRIAVWSIKKNEPSLLFDEPFRNVSPNYHELVSEMIVKLCESEDLQIILISHSPTINKKANMNYFIKKQGKISEATVV